ncbi:helix-turn-helix domain-containing protein [Canibacter zhoujuaniae]|uniref:helix-turn-helix domain-containing protein n=1 Tax=Canibacter zhoujuaniae TaxID=2708343 RepID=UPI001421EE0E|nr:helix-turn-helix transcriptional regulator [Canibacter zhoujuaniae]
MRPVNPSTNNTPLKIGDKIRAIRKAQGLTIGELADLVQVTKGYLSRLERDQTSPSVTTLMSICQTLAIPIGSLFEAPAVDLVPLSSAPLINLGGTAAVEKMITPRGLSGAQLIHSEMAPGSHGGHELYTINCKSEILHVIRGEVLVRFTDHTTSLKQGDTLTFAGSEPHTWESPAGATAVWCLIPAPWASNPGHPSA